MATVALSALLLQIVGFACTSDDPPFVVTVMAAQVGGILIEEDGCLRTTDSSGTAGKAIVWQKDVLTIERQEDTVNIYQGEISDGEAPIASWRLGDLVIGGGGMIGPEIADEHAGAGFSERCEGPYSLIGSVR